MTTTTVNPVLLLTAVVRGVERLSPSFVRIQGLVLIALGVAGLGYACFRHANTST